MSQLASMTLWGQELLLVFSGQCCVDQTGMNDRKVVANISIQNSVPLDQARYYNVQGARGKTIMRLPEEVLHGLKQTAAKFVYDDSGKGLAEYGAILAAIMLVVGFVWGQINSVDAPKSGKAQFTRPSSGPVQNSWIGPD